MPAILKGGFVDRMKQNGAANLHDKKRAAPLWKGPESSDPLGGITFSLLSRFLGCRERFRLYAIEGLRPAASFNHRTAYGDMWHLCEEALAVDVNTGLPESRSTLWVNSLRVHAQDLCKQFPLQQSEIEKWYSVCRLQFPIYVDYWSKHADVKDRTPIFQEFPFRIPIKLPSGRTIYLRGKFDSVDFIGE